MSSRTDGRRDACGETVHCTDYVMGELIGAKLEAFEAHLLEGCPICAAELERLRRAAAVLDLAADEEQPPAGLRERVLAGAASMRAGGIEFADRTAGDETDDATIEVLREGDTDWQLTDVPGVEVRVLYQDQETRRVSTLLRMAAGTTFPAHLHRGREECYVIEGDLRFGERVVTAGDFMVAEPGTVHGSLSSRGGCVALVHNSLDDERLG